jgi:hypothetical protein
MKLSYTMIEVSGLTLKLSATNGLVSTMIIVQEHKKPGKIFKRLLMNSKKQMTFRSVKFWIKTGRKFLRLCST